MISFVFLWILSLFVSTVHSVCIRELEPFVGAVLRNTSLDFVLHYPTGLYDQGWGGLGIRADPCPLDDASCMATTNFIIFTKRTLQFAEIPAGKSSPRIVSQWSSPPAGLSVSSSRLCCTHALAIDVDLSILVSPAAIERNVTLLFAYSRDDWPSPHVARGHITLSIKSLGQLTPDQQCLTTGGDAVAAGERHAVSPLIQSLALTALFLASPRSLL
jgi:hypothetical protein